MWTLTIHAGGFIDALASALLAVVLCTIPVRSVAPAERCGACKTVAVRRFSRLILCSSAAAVIHISNSTCDEHGSFAAVTLTFDLHVPVLFTFAQSIARSYA